MAIRGEAYVRSSTFEEGLDNSSPICTAITANTLSLATNVDLLDNELLKTRPGYSVVNSSADWSTRIVRQGYSCTKTNGDTTTLVYGHATTPTGISGILGKLSGTAAPTTIVSSLMDNVKPTMIQFKSLVFYFDGYGDFVYNPNDDTTRQIGITEPPTGPALSSTTTGDLNTEGAYVFVYTYYNSLTGAESSPSAPSTILTTGSSSSSAGFILTMVAGDSSTADTIRMYRTTAGGNIFYLDGTTAISGTTYTSTVRDAGLGQRLELDNSRLTGYAKYATVADNRLFVAGFANNRNRVQYSKIGVNGPMPESFQVADFCDCNANDDDQIVGLGKTKEAVIVLKNNSVGRLLRIQASGFGLELGGSQKYVYDEISSEVTCASGHSILNIEGFCIWLGRDDIYATDGANIYRMGTRITKTIKSLNHLLPHKISAVVDTDNKKIIFSVLREGATESDFQIVGSYKNLPKIAWRIYSSGPSTVTYPGIISASLFKAYSSGQRRIYFGNSTGNGKIYYLGGAKDDNGSAIYVDWATAWIDGVAPEKPKMFHSVYSYVAGESGLSTSITAILETDPEAQSTVTSVAGTLSPLSAATWDGGTTWDFTWAGTNFTRLKFYPRKKAYFGRIRFQTSTAGHPVRFYKTSAKIQVHNEVTL